MTNENNQPYFLLVFEYEDSMPTIISADVISEMYPDRKKQKLDITDKNGNSISFEYVTSFKMVHIDYIM